MAPPSRHAVEGPLASMHRHWPVEEFPCGGAPSLSLRFLQGQVGAVPITRLSFRAMRKRQGRPALFRRSPEQSLVSYLRTGSMFAKTGQTWGTPRFRRNACFTATWATRQAFDSREVRKRTSPPLRMTAQAPTAAPWSTATRPPAISRPASPTRRCSDTRRQCPAPYSFPL